MRIVNPLYDKAFEYLMENDKFAKKVLSVILDTEVVEVALAQQETLFPDEKRRLTLFRLDFKAVIQEPGGERKTVLIELQKSKYITDIHRFRNYLGANYMSKPKEKESETNRYPEYHTAYPIITIYILGYKLEDLPYMAVSVNREIINSVSKEKLDVKSFFVEHLTHQSHIIQVKRLPEKRQTSLERFLTLFNQKWITDKEYILDLKELPEEYSEMATYLSTPLSDEEFRRNLEAEEELDLIFDEQEAKYMKQIAAEKKGREEAEKAKAETEKMLEIERRERDADRRQKEELAVKLAVQMKKFGASTEEIARETGLSLEEIMRL
ncbi:hypothetical protein Ctha_2275 [Chloroherpeton thalassium ATCC 35110]|uniref:Uncharacterized protein n=1 Tax=Chloroherpeton thalassium (strain ATCC 35110 / GB-78) TaxID=517418 RepID=B3QWG6_CHLT3|nr:hypothetical protein [Chloroherpeton thalassium]ACF14726.1 hypothetical protein Ctha_2275 [Chloroherpeton thalassium ATCC 35110]